MDAEGFDKWLGTTHLQPDTQGNAISYCREIEPLIGDLDEVVRDPDRMATALRWLKNHPEEYVIKGRLMLEGAAQRRWALRKYKKFVHSSRSMSAKAGS
jgi:hypothetical protein